MVRRLFSTHPHSCYYNQINQWVVLLLHCYMMLHGLICSCMTVNRLDHSSTLFSLYQEVSVFSSVNHTQMLRGLFANITSKTHLFNSNIPLHLEHLNKNTRQCRKHVILWKISKDTMLHQHLQKKNKKTWTKLTMVHH